MNKDSLTVLTNFTHAHFLESQKFQPLQLLSHRLQYPGLEVAQEKIKTR